MANTRNDLISRLRKYENFLNQKIVSYHSIAREESLSGAITAEAEARVLEEARDKMYEAFPELKPNKSSDKIK